MIKRSAVNLLQMAAVAIPTLLSLGTSAPAQTLGDLECRRVSILEFEASVPLLNELRSVANNPVGMLAIGTFGPAFVTEVSAEGTIAVELEEVRAIQIGGTAPQRACRIRARVKITYSRAAMEPDTRLHTTTTIIRRPVSATLVTELAYDMTFAGAGDNVELLETELGDLLIQTLALDAKAKNEGAVTREMHQAIAQKEALIRGRQMEADRAEFEAREAENRRVRELNRDREEQRQRQEQAARDRANQQFAEEARRRDSERREAEKSQERAHRLERLRGYLANAEARLSRLTRPNERADQERRVDEIRAQIAIEETR
ncbi:MAG: hypothetical protein JNK84_12460 [Phreatobacter sp.]|jgi:hypothetical protein|uniref:hypothetical protein n=1 Tax=Phreatobacter sp. TaxID=1966341 RepID=UPI001A37768E|nr:hypothetical protein [Phreatobacter sp.]MBL8569878.1 hypothetical protein [Phreatobacter sp.]MCA0320686.1 hypothetical protein [Pseudomonadota bacterium]